MLMTSDRPQRRGNLLFLPTLAVDLRSVVGLIRYGQDVVIFLEGGSEMRVGDFRPVDHKTILKWWTEVRFGKAELPDPDEVDYSDPSAIAAMFRRRYDHLTAEVPLDTEIHGFNVMEWHGSRIRFQIDTDRKARGIRGGRNDMWFSGHGKTKCYVPAMTDADKAALDAACVRALPKLHALLAAQLSGETS